MTDEVRDLSMIYKNGPGMRLQWPTARQSHSRTVLPFVFRRLDSRLKQSLTPHPSHLHAKPDTVSVFRFQSYSSLHLLPRPFQAIVRPPWPLLLHTTPTRPPRPTRINTLRPAVTANVISAAPSSFQVSVSACAAAASSHRCATNSRAYLLMLIQLSSVL